MRVARLEQSVKRQRQQLTEPAGGDGRCRPRSLVARGLAPSLDVAVHSRAWHDRNRVGGVDGSVAWRRVGTPATRSSVSKVQVDGCKQPILDPDFRSAPLFTDAGLGPAKAQSKRQSHIAPVPSTLHHHQQIDPTTANPQIPKRRSLLRFLHSPPPLCSAGATLPNSCPSLQATTTKKNERLRWPSSTIDDSRLPSARRSPHRFQLSFPRRPPPIFTILGPSQLNIPRSTTTAASANASSSKTLYLTF